MADAVDKYFDQLCDRFEQAWKSGQQPRIEEVLGIAQDPERSVLLRKLLRVELDVINRTGITWQPSTYRERFPEHAELVDAILTETVSFMQSPGGTVSQSKAPPAESNPPTLNAKLGRFEILKVLGQGAMGTVHHARDPKLERDVAIKVPRLDALKDEEQVKRFLREAQAAATLRHPNICPVYEIFEVDRRYAIVMAFIFGKPLSACIKDQQERPITERQAANLVRKLALALHVAHQNGIVHRDLKPDNIMIDQEQGEPVITDFGLARMTSDDELHLTASGQIMGTPAYMPPEQARGDLQQIGPASDIYSLGVIFYELLCGKRPFTSLSVPEMLSDILRREPQLPSVHRPSINRRLEAICMKAMAKKIEDRYKSMAELAATLSEYLRAASHQANAAVSPQPTMEPKVTDADNAPISPASHDALPLAFGTSTEAGPSKPLLRVTRVDDEKKPGSIHIAARRSSALANRRRTWSQRHVFAVSGAAVTLLTGVVLYVTMTPKLDPLPAPLPATPQLAKAPPSVNNPSMPSLNVASTRDVVTNGTSPSSADQPTVAIAPSTADKAQAFQQRWAKQERRPVEVTNTIGMKLVLIPPGDFFMGSPESEESRSLNEIQHPVRISNAFYMGAFEVTQAEYEQVMGNNPCQFAGEGRLPVGCVTWDDAVEFCDKLSALPNERAAGLIYRLPSEAEWEYACRAGTTTAFCYGDSLTAREARMSASKPMPVGSYAPNAFGLYDMHGNIQEWCADWYDSRYYAASEKDNPLGPSQGSHRIIRGGGWGHSPTTCRSAHRFWILPTDFAADRGFRVVMDPPPNDKDLADPPLPIGPSSSPATALVAQTTNQREVAEWVLKLGGKIQLKARQTISGLMQLPVGTISILGVTLDNVAIPDGDLSPLLPATGLETLSLSRSSVDGSSLALLREFKSLRELYIRELPGVTGVSVSFLRELKQLERFGAGATKIGDEGLAYLSDLTELRSVDMGSLDRDAGVTDAGLKHLRKLTQLEFLSLESNIGIDGTGFQYLSGLTKVKTLWLDQTSITDEGLQYIGVFNSLENTRMNRLRSSGITDLGVRHFESLLSLKVLEIKGCQVTDDGLRSIAKLPRLQLLNLEGTQLGDSCFEQLKTAKSLTVLGLTRTNITLAGVQSFKQELPNCHVHGP